MLSIWTTGSHSCWYHVHVLYYFNWFILFLFPPSNSSLSALCGVVILLNWTSKSKWNMARFRSREWTWMTNWEGNGRWAIGSRVICFLELVCDCDRSTHGKEIGIVSCFHGWKSVTSFDNLLFFGQRIDFDEIRWPMWSKYRHHSRTLWCGPTTI